MKFGKTLLSNQIPEWSKNYLSYKSLKKSIKEGSHRLPASEEVITAIFFQLDRELEKVDTFYTYKQGQIDRRIWILEEKFNQSQNTSEESADPTKTSEDITEELVSALQETCGQINKLIWFGELNTKGFRKILKKVDKKLGIETQTVYWEAKVSVLPFANHAQLRSEILKLESRIALLTNDEAHSASLKPTNTLPSSVSVKLSLSSSLENQQLAKAVEEDDVEKLNTLIKDAQCDVDQTLYSLLEVSMRFGSLQCLDYLVYKGVKAYGHQDINERNILHKMAILSGSLEPKAFAAIRRLLDLEPELDLQRDFASRLPLHYAAETDQVEMAAALLEHAVKQGHYTQVGFADPVWLDRDGLSPLFLAILRGHHETTRVLIEVGNVKDIDQSISAPPTSNGVSDYVPDFARSTVHPSPVAVACKLANLALLVLLIDKGASVDMPDEDGENALTIAVRNSFAEGVLALISRGNANVNLAEKINGMTPLMIAAMEGHVNIADMLLNAGADKTRQDANGWTAYEHAVFRGFLNIAKITKPDETFLNSVGLPTRADLVDGGSDSRQPNGKGIAKASRMYGHKYLTDQSMIIITLGSNDIRNHLSRNFLNLTKPLTKDQRLSIVVSATNATGEFPTLDLPSDNQNHLLHPEPIIMFTANPEDVVLRFDIIETFGSSPTENNILARGTAILAGDQIYTKSKAFKGQVMGNASLRGQHTAPLVNAKTLEYVGSVSFEFFVVTPFSHPNMTVGDRYTYYKSVDIKVIGHRGSGMNKKGSQLQVGENTVLSFVTAASLGAEYVEFDVQLTKDLVPVIYHDWTVTETGFDIPLNAITVEQFLNLRRSGHIKEYHTGVSNGAHGELIPTINNTSTDDDDMSSSSSATSTERPSRDTSPGRRLNRSHSLSSMGSPKNSRTDKRLALTRTNKLGKVKGNGPDTIQAPFTTLAETLQKVPKSAGCNIEVKYPMIDEAEGEELHQFQELNIFVDTILQCVYDNAGKDRRIIFSSFHPEICLALNLKQPNYPVFFLTDAGTLPMADVRCNSIQGAIRFAKQADLLGIVAASEPILEAPRMVKMIKETGLLLFTYGVLNNEVQNAVTQQYYGVDAVIVDSVLAIRKGLRGDQSVPTQTKETA